MKLKTILAVFFAVLGFSTVHAENYSLGALSAGSGSTGEKSVGPGSFEDVYSFSLAGLSDFSGVITVNVDNNNFRIDQLSLSSVLGSQTFSGNTFAVSSMNPGSYELSILGNATGEKGGKYQLSWLLTPVPEPGIFAMFLAGLGLMGVIARRRSSQV